MSTLGEELEKAVREAIAAAVAGKGTPTQPSLPGIPDKGSPSTPVLWRNRAFQVPDTFSLTWLGKSKEEATAQAMAEGRYIADWRLECSTDGGQTWHTQPDIRDIPKVT